MKSKPSKVPKLSTSEQYKLSKQQGRLKQLAQKLSQQIENLAEDENTRERWIWELIQNAKDVSNQFGKVKIRIQISDKRLRFSHNGDPFKTSDLESIVSQYSSKDEKNSQEIETTGKYGTGFITTYILSRVVEIQGLIQVTGEPKDEMPSDSEDSNSDQEKNSKKRKKNWSQNLDENSIIEDLEFRKLKNKKVKTQQILEKTDSKMIQSQVNLNIKQRNQLMTVYQEQPANFFQKFNIKLDRSYNDRDKQFLVKLMRTENRIMSDLEKLKLEKYWERNQDDLDTTFSYQNLDIAAFSMIEKGIESIKNIFSYALLFNKKLYQIEVIDKRTVKKFKDFTIKKEKQKTINKIIKISNCSYREEGTDTRIISLAYKQDKATHSIVAIPIELNGNSITVLEVKKDIPKVFKQFPLIGCKDTGFNFVFTSKKFYPNQTRSELLLKSIQGRTIIKADQNWQCLRRVFPLAKQLLTLMSTRAVQGIENYLVMRGKNHYTTFEGQNFNLYLQDYKKDIVDLDMIPTESGQKRKLKGLIFFMDETKPSKTISFKQIGELLNEKFKFLYSTNCTLPKQVYSRFYDKMRIYKEEFKDIIEFKNLNDCLKSFSSRYFETYASYWGSQKEAIQQIKGIYDFISSYRTNYMDMKAPNGCNYPIILTNKKKFREFKGMGTDENLKVKHKLPSAYEQLADLLQIDFNENLVHDELSQYIVNPKYFGIKEMEDLFSEKFANFKKFDDQRQKNKFIEQLGNFLETYKIGKDILKLAKQTKRYKDIEAYKVDQKQLKKLKHEKYYVDLFKKLFLEQANQMVKETNLTYFSSKSLQHGVSAIQWFNKALKLSISLKEETQNPIKFSLAWDQKFRNFNLLFKIKQGYPKHEDVNFYELVKQEYKRIFSSNELEPLPLKSQIQHPQIQIKPTNQKNFEDVFGFAVQLYQKITETKKLQYLEYIDKIYAEYKKDKTEQYKYTTFKKIIQKRHKYLIQISSNLKQEQKDFIYSMIRRNDQMKYARELFALDSFKTIYIVYKEFKDNSGSGHDDDKKVRQKKCK